MSTFIQAVEQELNKTETLNGAPAYKSTMNSCLDLFGKIAASRMSIDNVRRLFLLAYSEHPETAIRILFWARDIRGGQGERKVFKELFKDLVNKNKTVAKNLIKFIPHYGRWDDLFVLEDTKIWENVLELISSQLSEDCSSENQVSLLGKWLPSINASSLESKRIGRKIASYLGKTEKEYRKMLTELRKKIKIVETQMCSGQWTSIEYDKIPSRASYMYRNAFRNHDADGYSKFLLDVENGDKKINSGTIYPYEIVEKHLDGLGNSDDKTLNLMWESLPNYMENQHLNGLVVADVSGSMHGRPMAVSISLAMYISERNTGIWKNKFMTFSSSPQMLTVVGNTIQEKIYNLSRAPWGCSTDIQAVFDLILSTACKHEISNEDMPKKLIIVSDMQFNSATGVKTNFELIKDKYKKSGYSMPDLVFWNVNDIGDNVPMTMHDSGTCLVSGCSPSILKAVLKNQLITPIDIMNEAVYSNRYDDLASAL